MGHRADRGRQAIAALAASSVYVPGGPKKSNFTSHPHAEARLRPRTRASMTPGATGRIALLLYP